MPYEQVPTMKIARPDTEEGFMIINQADYRADLPQWMYQQGLAYDPAVWQPYVEPVERARPATEPPSAPSVASAAAEPVVEAHEPTRSGSHRTTERR
jgi:hypothetical protein